MNTIISYQNKFNSNNINNKQNVKFKGLLPKTTSQKIIKKQINDNLYNISTILGQKPDNIYKMANKTSNKKLNFLDSLVYRYNTINYDKKVKENSKHINNIFEIVKKPNKKHFYIINNVKTDLENLEKIFKKIDGNTKKLNLVQNVQEDLNNEHVKNPNLIMNLLDSHNSETYAKDFKKYKSYLIVNNENPDAIKNLDKMVDSKTFNQKKYDIESSNKKTFKYIEETPIFNKNTLNEIYTKEGQKVINKITKDYALSNNSIKSGNDKDLINIYKSTTNKNVDIRMDIVEHINTNPLANHCTKIKNNDITQLNKLFNKIDNDKDAKKFVKKSVKNDLPINTAQEFNQILSTNNPKKLNIFFDNAKNIIIQTKNEKRLDTLKKELKNPFFETKETHMYKQYQIEYGSIRKESIFSKTGKYLKNKFNILLDKMTDSKQKTTLNTTKTNNPIQEIKPKRKLFNTLTITKTPNNKKIAVINDVNSIIEKKLGTKTLNEQKRDYAIKATKMRMQMLPEIFASIKETRAKDRSIGKLKINSSNKDALTLYENINGRNKKLVNYMLKKRNTDGSRMFEVKDIITTIDNADKKIITNKKLDSKYSAKDAKTYYENLTNSKIQQFGK